MRVRESLCERGCRGHQEEMRPRISHYASMNRYSGSAIDLIVRGNEVSIGESNQRVMRGVMVYVGTQYVADCVMERRRRQRRVRVTYNQGEKGAK